MALLVAPESPEVRVSSLLAVGVLLSLSVSEPQQPLSLVPELASPLAGSGGDAGLYAQSCLMAGGGMALMIGGVVGGVLVGISGSEDDPSSVGAVLVPAMIGALVSTIGIVVMVLGFSGMAVFGGGGDAPIAVLPEARPLARRDAAGPPSRTLLAWSLEL